VQPYDWLQKILILCDTTKISRVRFYRWIRQYIDIVNSVTIANIRKHKQHRLNNDSPSVWAIYIIISLLCVACTANNPSNTNSLDLSSDTAFPALSLSRSRNPPGEHFMRVNTTAHVIFLCHQTKISRVRFYHWLPNVKTIYRYGKYCHHISSTLKHTYLRRNDSPLSWVSLSIKYYCV
jgi:hypothetical protein